MVKCLLLFICALPLSAVAQFPLPSEFIGLLDSFDVRVNHPLGGDFELLETHPNTYLTEQARLWSKKEKLELRFAAVRDEESASFYQMPHVRAAHLLLNLASNDEDAVTTVLSPDEAELAVLNADWARVYVFRPKRSFSRRAMGQLVASYKEGRGMLYTVLLFDRPPASLEGRQLSLRWR